MDEPTGDCIPNINGFVATFYGPGQGNQNAPFCPIYFILPPDWPPGG